MVYTWVTSPVDEVAALSGFKMALQMGLAKAVSGTHTVVHSNFLCSMPRVSVHMSRRDLCVCCTGKSNFMETFCEATTSHSKAIYTCACF